MHFEFFDELLKKVKILTNKSIFFIKQELLRRVNLYNKIFFIDKFKYRMREILLMGYWFHILAGRPSKVSLIKELMPDSDFSGHFT